MDAPIDWLLEGDAWIAYRTRMDMLGQSEKDDAVKAARAGMLADSRVQALVTELGNWPGKVIASHKSAGQPFHRLTFLADLGLRADDPGVDQITARIFEHPSAEGPFQLSAAVSSAYGGTGREVWAWALCDAPLILYALVKFGLQEDPRVRAGIAYLAGLARENGWPCVVSQELGSFRGPGRREDPCPFATLAMLKLCAQVDWLRDSSAARSGAEALLSLWSDSRTRHPYIFYMGTDFRKLKAPFVWYDLMHVLDVLSGFAWLKGDARLQDMLGVLQRKADDQGRFTVESVWTAWKDWEFGQKKEPSRWLTLMAWRVMKRNAQG
ncbi:hypothetical protein LARV_03705 [Longilinea arvoryzae]|uniref:Uncharacterized protein n=1 Tax=Longilinea arvoryzae TaxID=360412 RepID=A0A0K8MXH7_9CHLR|nr:hypothetical protein [Longilinea arvoryzae]GAP15910.1 hypothetical protein LARV_03705 [Longilinea arvoryzae]